MSSCNQICNSKFPAWDVGRSFCKKGCGSEEENIKNCKEVTCNSLCIKHELGGDDDQQKLGKWSTFFARAPADPQTCLTACITVKADNYAVLVAGSNGFWNYRHQADVCHNYQLLIQRGFKAENIIVLSYGDVAPDSENPFPNKLFNKPTQDKPGVDVNAGCVIDYKGEDVNPANYLAVIQGDSQAVKGKGTGRVLQSTENDYVFLTFFDHGAAGLIGFPSDYLYATDLAKALKNMHDKKMYKQLVYYLEACESGSMFNGFPKDLNIYAVTAANETESSWGTYCGDDAVVQGVNIGSCLGDLFSVNWMEDTDASTDENYHLQDQFLKVQKLTIQSHVMQYGDLSWSPNTPISTFQGHHRSSFVEKIISMKNKGLNFLGIQQSKENKQYHSIDSRQIKLQYLLQKFNKNSNDENFTLLQTELHQIKFFNDIFKTLQTKLNLNGNYDSSQTNFDCYKQAIQVFNQRCGKMTESTYGNFRYLQEVCTVYPIEEAISHVSQMC